MTPDIPDDGRCGRIKNAISEIWLTGVDNASVAADDGTCPDAFALVMPVLSQRYHLIVSAIPGLEPEEPDQDFTSIEEIAAVEYGSVNMVAVM